MRVVPSVLLGLILACCLARLAGAGDISAIGRKIDDFSLIDHRGKFYTLDDFADAKVLVVAFVGVDCPLAKQYTGRLKALAREFEPRGVAFVAIDSNCQDTLADLAAFVRAQAIDFPLLKDVGSQIADRFGANRTPEVFVLDAARVVRYGGRIDDQYDIGIQRPRPTRRDLATALAELLDGKSVSVPSTDAVGCFIGRRREPKQDGPVTYSKQIARLLQHRCVECHRTGEVAPFALTSYDEAVGWGDTIREVVETGRMPPWFADPQYGKFQNDGHLSDEERRLITQWVEDGCPQGDPRDLPPARQFVEGWGMPQPDAVFYISDTPVAVPAEGVVEYKYFTIDPGWTEDKWICGSEARAGNSTVVHHILVFIQRPGKFYIPGLPGELVSAYAPGMKPTVAPDGMAVLAPAGSKIVVQMHYTPNGTPQTDRSYVGLRFRKPEEVQSEIKAGMAINLALRIPPYTDDFEVKAKYKFMHDAILLGVNPHMHLRGKTFRYEALYPDGTREILMDCPRYDFNWQLGYQYVEPKPMPKGTTIFCTARYDNSTNNPSNPDPSRQVTFGEQTWDEMLIGWFFAAERRETAGR